MKQSRPRKAVIQGDDVFSDGKADRLKRAHLVVGFNCGRGKRKHHNKLNEIARPK